MLKKKSTLALLAVLAAVALASFALRPGDVSAPGPSATGTPPAVATTTASTTPVVVRPPVLPPPPPPATSTPVDGRSKFLAGPITEVGDGSFKMRVNLGNIRTIVIGDATELRRYVVGGSTLEPMPFSDLVPGLSVRVRGFYSEDGTLLATTVTTGQSSNAGTGQTLRL